MNRLTREMVRFRQRFSEGPDRAMLLLTVEGGIYTLMTNLANNNNNLFATRLGANDFQLSLLSLLSQLVGMLVLIPGAIYTDRLQNKRKMVIFTLVVICGAFLLAAGSAFAGELRLTLFLICISLSAGANALYNSSWQAFFADAVPLRRRNACYSMRTRITFVIGIIVPLITGALLTAQETDGGKILMHQLFLVLAAGSCLLQVMVLRRVEGGTVGEPAGATMRDFFHAGWELARNRRFLGLAVVALLFYMCWHLDWTMYFIAQTRYVGLNELWLSISSGASALAQFITIGFWARRNERRGVRFGMVMGAFGLMLAPMAVIVPMALDLSVRPIVHVVLRAVCDLTCANVTLNILQCLLQVIGEKNRTLSIAVYTLLITLSNAFLPMAGVAIYTALGGDAQACIQFYWLTLVLRIGTTLFWLLRWRRLRGQDDR